MKEPTLGLCAEPIPQYLFIGQDEGGSGSCWYSLDYSKNEKNPAKIYHTLPGVKGYITGLRIKTSKTSHGEKAKLDVSVESGDESFVVRAGADTQFARSLILSLLAIDKPQELTGILTIVTHPGEKNRKIVFARVYVGARQIKYVYDGTMDLADPFAALQAILGSDGQSDEESDSAEDVPDHETPWNQGEQPSAPATNNAANEAQVKELKRCGVVAGLAHKLEGEELDISELNRECARLYDGKKIDEISRDQAIEFRKTLLEL
jgi:hypothetical protein